MMLPGCGTVLQLVASLQHFVASVQQFQEVWNDSTARSIAAALCSICVAVPRGVERCYKGVEKF